MKPGAAQMLPLAGDPELVVVGREVQLGSGYADLIAVESTGCLAILEIKLSKSAEAKRAIVAQTLSYAAYLHGFSYEGLEELLGRHLMSREFESLSAAASSVVQGRPFEESSFVNEISQNLESGRFRLVFVLDEAPPELVRLAGYLEAIAGDIAIDLVTVSAYQISGTEVIVPQRVEPDRVVGERNSSSAKGYESPGSDVFEASITAATPEHQSLLRRILDWARRLESEGLARLSTYKGWTGTNLLPRVAGGGGGIVTIYNEPGRYAMVTMYRSVLERLAPETLLELEELFRTCPDQAGICRSRTGRRSAGTPDQGVSGGF